MLQKNFNVHGFFFFKLFILLRFNQALFQYILLENILISFQLSGIGRPK